MPAPVRSRRVAKAAFAYSCLSTILYTVLHVVVAVLGRPELIFSHENANVWFGLGCLHMLVLQFTFGPYARGPAYEFGWPTLIDPTENAVRIARVVLGWPRATLCIGWFSLFVFEEITKPLARLVRPAYYSQSFSQRLGDSGWRTSFHRISLRPLTATRSCPCPRRSCVARAPSGVRYRLTNG